LNQLPYVLEHQRSIVQGKLIVWIVTLIQFQLAHYGESPCNRQDGLESLLTRQWFIAGTDFTFRFKWINQSPSINASH
jgi:hypothetical protein